MSHGCQMNLILQGVGLFAFIPLVLFLYLRQPLGPGLSILAGVVIMIGHRFVAAPWMVRHAGRRCLWCGRGLSGKAPLDSARGREASPCSGGTPDAAQDFSPVRLPVFSSGRELTLAACRPAHRDHAARFLTFLLRCRAAIAAGIFVPLLVLLAGSLAIAAGRPVLSHAWNAWQFKTVVAFTVVLTSIAYRFGPAGTGGTPGPPLRSPFPLHNFFLLGIRNTLWVFRLVGAWWLAAGLLQVLPR